MSGFLEEEARRREKQRVNYELWALKNEEEAHRQSLQREINDVKEDCLTYEDLQNELEPIKQHLKELEERLAKLEQKK